MSTEHRSFSVTPPIATGRKVSGYAATFNTRSQNLGGEENQWMEVIKPGAFDDVLNDDVRALFNHDPSQILARSKNGKGTLKITVDSIGLRYEFEAPDTRCGNDLLESIRRGDVDQSSFGFIVAKGGDSWRNDGRIRIRTISKVSRLTDVSPVTYPAYTESTVSARHKSQRSTAPLSSSSPGYWMRRFNLFK